MGFVAFIQEMAATAGWKAVVPLSETLVRLPFNSDEGEINVFIRPCGKLSGKTVLEFRSLGIPLPDDGALKVLMMETVLSRNGDLLQGYWGIIASDEEKKLAVLATQIAETMDPPEFEGSVLAVVREYSNMIGILRKAVQRSKVDF